MRSRGQFNFSWIFALIIGGSILVLAIYGAVNGGDAARRTTDTKIARSLSILIDPLQAGFSDSKYDVIKFGDVTRLNNFCSPVGFGYNEISIATRSNVLDEWTIPGVPTLVGNKYLFSDERMEGEIYHVLSKPFNFPYKVSDLIFISTDNYCFIGAPREIVDEVETVQNINTTGCSEDDNLINVCFGSGPNCDIEVIGSCRSGDCNTLYDRGSVSKSGYQVKYVGSLMYGAIFSDRDVYTCNVDRLLYRTGRIAEVFAQKAKLMNLRGCNTRLGPTMEVFGGRLVNSTHEDLLSIEYYELDRRNDGEACGLWD